MFTADERERVSARVVELARADRRVTAAAFTGSAAVGAVDRWSDVDLAFAVVDGVDLEEMLAEWTDLLSGELDVLHHWDLASGTAIYRVFLLRSCLEVDIALVPARDFGARGPQFRLLFGESVDRALSPPEANFLIGLGWHHVLHARACIERGRLWQAEYLISALRDHTLALGCLRLGESAHHAKGVHRLPGDVTAPLEGALVRSLDGDELRRALRVAAEGFLAELAQFDAALATSLEPVLREFADDAHRR